MPTTVPSTGEYTSVPGGAPTSSALVSAIVIATAAATLTDPSDVLASDSVEPEPWPPPAVAPPEARVWFDLSRVQGPVDGVLHLCREVGPGRLLFGTNVPLHVAASPVLEVADAVAAGLPEGDAGALRYANAGVALGLTPLQDERHPAPPAGLSSGR